MQGLKRIIPFVEQGLGYHAAGECGLFYFIFLKEFPDQVIG